MKMMREVIKVLKLFFICKVHERDTQLRKQSSEMEAVLFRNQQLAKRINLLQEEAEAAASKKGKSRWKRDRSGSKERHSHQSNSLGVDSAEQVINEELVSKITENAELKVKLNDIETQHTANTQALKLRIEDLEREKAQLNSGVKVRETEASNFANDLKMETSQLNTKMEYLEKELVEKNDKIVTLQVQLESSMDKCDSLEKQATPIKSSDAETQYSFVDEALEEVRASEIRERESLAHRLDTNMSKIKDLEKDREHWKLEYQLIQIKMEKLKQESGPSSEVTNLELDEVMALREEELKSVWEAKIDELIASRLMADSKAVAYYLELEALTSRLYSKEKEGEKLFREASTRNP